MLRTPPVSFSVENSTKATVFTLVFYRQLILKLLSLEMEQLIFKVHVPITYPEDALSHSKTDILFQTLRVLNHREVRIKKDIFSLFRQINVRKLWAWDQIILIHLHNL